MIPSGYAIGLHSILVDVTHITYEHTPSYEYITRAAIPLQYHLVNMGVYLVTAYMLKRLVRNDIIKDIATRSLLVIKRICGYFRINRVAINNLKVKELCLKLNIE